MGINERPLFHKEVRNDGLNGGKRETVYHAGPLNYTVNHRYSDEYDRKVLAVPVFSALLLLGGYILSHHMECRQSPDHDRYVQSLESKTR
ncbi:hypothetical protein KW787_00825 [Candidatus Pacearchaeota archaeon]|nr:hypothetical protein [Candidatus Pacearchaeota archaeon]